MANAPSQKRMVCNAQERGDAVKAFFLGVTAIDGVCGVVDSFKPQTPEMIAATAFFSLTAFIAFAAFAIIRAIEKAGIK
jgi:hypothetical protein